MQNNFIQAKNGQIILQQSQFFLLLGVIAVVIALTVIVVLALKSRKKDFIKTIPTNIKDADK